MIIRPPELPEGITYEIERVLFHDAGTYWAECYVWIINHRVYCRKTGREIILTEDLEDERLKVERRFEPKKKMVR